MNHFTFFFKYNINNSIVFYGLPGAGTVVLNSASFQEVLLLSPFEDKENKAPTGETDLTHWAPVWSKGSNPRVGALPTGPAVLLPVVCSTKVDCSQNRSRSGAFWVMGLNV